jgi:hypothetical protein
MPISKISIEKLTQMGFNIDEIVKAVKSSDEVDVTTPLGKFYSDEQIGELKTNVKKGHEEAYAEIYGKQLNEKYGLGLSTSDAKDHDKLHAAMQKKAVEAAKVEPTKQVEELKASLKKLQEEVIPMKEKEASEWKSKYAEREEFERYASLIPKDANKFLTKEEHVARIKKHVKIAEDGTAIDPNTGEAYKDHLEKPRKYDEVVAELYTKNEGWTLKEAAEPDNKKPFHHSTNTNPYRAAGEFDIDKVAAEAQEMYPSSMGAQAAALRQKHITAAQVAHAQANNV